MPYTQNWDASTAFPAPWYTTGSTPLTYWTVDSGAPAGSLSGNNALRTATATDGALAIYQGSIQTGSCTLSASFYFPDWSSIGAGDIGWYLYALSSNDTDVYTGSVYVQVFSGITGHAISLGYYSGGVATPLASATVVFDAATWYNVSLVVETDLSTTVAIQEIASGLYYDSGSGAYDSAFRSPTLATDLTGYFSGAGYAGIQAYPNEYSLTSYSDDFYYGPASLTLVPTTTDLTLTLVEPDSIVSAGYVLGPVDPIALTITLPAPDSIGIAGYVLGGITLLPTLTIYQPGVSVTLHAPVVHLTATPPTPTLIAAWRYTRTVTVPHASLTEDLAQFPVLVRLALDPAHWTGFAAVKTSPGGVRCASKVLADDGGDILLVFRGDLSATSDSLFTVLY